MVTKQIQFQSITQTYWNNKHVLITGGTAGLGKGLAKNLTELGSKVAVVGRNKDRLTNIKSEIPAIVPIQADISNEEDIHKIIGEVVGSFGASIDVLINNASSLGTVPLQNLIDIPCEKFSEVLETNLLGPFRLTKTVLPSMILRESGLIVNISSDASINAYPTWGIYGVSKAALDHLTAIWSTELPNISMISIDPGDMLTEMHLQADPDVDDYSLYDPDEVAKDLSKFIALGNNCFPKVRYSANEWREDLQ